MEEKSKDPDLGIVLKSFKEEFKVIFKPFVWIVKTSIRFKYVTLISGIIGAALGFVFCLTQTPYYKSDLVFSHERLSNDYCFEMTNTLSNLIGNYKNNAYLGKKLSVSDVVVQNLKSINYVSVNAELSKFYKDSSNVKLPFKIEVETYDISTLDSLQAGLLRYFELNEYALKLREVDLVLLKEKETRIAGELQEIDSLKLVVSKSIIPRSTGNGIILGEPVNPMSLYNSSNFLYDKQTEVKRKQLLNKSFYVVVGFSENAKAAGLGKLSFMILGSFIVWMIGLLIVALRTRSGS